MDDPPAWRSTTTTSQPPQSPAHLWWNATNRMGNRVPVEQIAQLLVLQQVHGHLSVLFNKILRHGK